MGAENRPDLRAEERLPAEDLAPVSHEAVGFLLRLGVLDDPVRRAAVVQLAQIRDHPLEGAPARAHPAHRGDLRAEGEDRLDPERRAHERLRRADAAAAAQVLERVEAEPDVEARAGAPDRLEDRVHAPAPLRRARRRDDEAAKAAGAGLAVDDLGADSVARGDLARRLAAALARARQAACDVDGDDVAPGLGERLEDREEVADRRL